MVQFANAAPQGAVATGTLPGDVGVWLGVSHGLVQLLHLAGPVLRRSGAGAAQAAVGAGGRGGAGRDRFRSACAAGGVGGGYIRLRTGSRSPWSAAPDPADDRCAGRVGAGGVPFERVVSGTPGSGSASGGNRGGPGLDLRKVLHRGGGGGSGSVDVIFRAGADYARGRAHGAGCAFSTVRVVGGFVGAAAGRRAVARVPVGARLYCRAHVPGRRGPVLRTDGFGAATTTASGRYGGHCADVLRAILHRPACAQPSGNADGAGGGGPAAGPAGGERPGGPGEPHSFSGPRGRPHLRGPMFQLCQLRALDGAVPRARVS